MTKDEQARALSSACDSASAAIASLNNGIDVAAVCGPDGMVWLSQLAERLRNLADAIDSTEWDTTDDQG